MKIRLVGAEEVSEWGGQKTIDLAQITVVVNLQLLGLGVFQVPWLWYRVPNNTFFVLQLKKIFFNKRKITLHIMVQTFTCRGILTHSKQFHIALDSLNNSTMGPPLSEKAENSQQ